jgi:hypothetical protein
VTPQITTLVIASALVALAGCAKGPIHGQLTLPQGSSEPAALNYESSVFGKSGKLWMVLPTGEKFTGPYVLDPYAPDKSITSTLAGDRGNQLWCRLTLSEPGTGPDGGGAVRCNLSTGGTFEGSF